jgi:hypothetical protein
MSGTLRCTRPGAKKCANDGVREVSIGAQRKFTALRLGEEKNLRTTPPRGEFDFDGTIRRLKRRTMS